MRLLFSKEITNLYQDLREVIDIGRHRFFVAILRLGYNILTSENKITTKSA